MRARRERHTPASYPDLRAAAPTQTAMLPPGAVAAASVTATSVVATMALPPPPATAVAAGRRRPRPQSTLCLGIAHHERRPTSSNASTSASPSTLTNHSAPHAVADDQNEMMTLAPQRMFLRDAIVLAEKKSLALSADNATNAAAAAAAAGAGHGPDDPMRLDNGPYVRLMGRVVQMHSCDDTAGGNDDDRDVFSLVIDDGTASVHVVAGQLHRQQLDLGLQGPSAAKRPRLLQGSSRISELDLELGVLVDCVGYLSLAREIEAPVEEAADEEDQHEEHGIADNGEDKKIGAGAEQPDEQQEQENNEEPCAAESTETEQEAIEYTNEPIKEQSSFASPTNDDEASAHGKVPPEEECAACEDLGEHSDEQQAPPIYRAVLSAVFIAAISQPDAESLRTLELILAASSDQEITTSNTGSTGGNADEAIHGVHMAGGLVSRIGAFQHRSQEHQWQPSPGEYSAVDQHLSKAASETAHSICSNTAFRFIRSAAADGGISEEDLAIALGCINGSSSSKSSGRKSIIRRRSGGNNGRPSEMGDSTEVMAVRRVLQQLQTSGEIYKTRRGTYLPL